jgi:pyruvate dehydrogenase E1 component beta subunit
VKRVAVPNVPIPYSRPLEQFVIPQVGSLVGAVRELMNASVAQAVDA